MIDVSKLHLSDTPLSHISEIAWSDYTAADYTVEQWHAACLIHQHDGPPTSKGQCKLPVRTPNGAVNRNGVHAAAGALAGARGGVNASEEEKASAARALARLYAQLDEDPPASLLKHSDQDILEHFGRKGMKWGVRNEEDTGSPKQSRRETKAQKFDTKASVLNTRISDINKEIEQLPPGMRSYFKKNVLKNQVIETTKDRDRVLRDAEAVRNGKLTSTQKKVIAGGLVAAVVASGITYGVMRESGQLNSLKLRGIGALFGNEVQFAKNPNLVKPNMSPEDVLKVIGRGVNPKYAEPGGKMNCRRSTLTHELRRRGYDVRATTTSLGWGQSESGLINALTTDSKDKFGSTSLSSMVVNRSGIRGKIARDARLNPATKDTISEAISEARHVLPTLARQPNGSRGEIVFNFGAFAHSMAYEIFDGAPVIFDSQKGQMYAAEAGISALTHKWGIPSGAEITRLDDMPLDMNFLSRWATNV